MPNRIEYQELADLDGYKKALQSCIETYTAFEQHVTRLNGSIKESTQANVAELEKLRKSAASSSPDDSKLQAYASRAAAVNDQLAQQRATTESLSKSQKLQADVVGGLIQKQQSLISQYAALEGQDAKTIAARKRLAGEMTNLAGQLDRLEKPMAAQVQSVSNVSGQYDRMQKELAEARKSLKSLDNAFDENTGHLNKNNAEAVRLAGVINRNDTQLRKFDQTLGVHSRNIGNYPKNTQGALSSLVGMATGFLTLDAAMGAVKHVVSLTADFQKYQTILANTLGTQEAAAAAMELVQKVAAKTPYSVNEMTEAYVKLANRGFVATEKELISLADLAASTGKPFDQLVEAILDAQTGEFERLKEFGISAHKAGDQISFSFKGQTTTVKATGAEIQKYILSLGELNGVAGSTAGISATLTGQLSNLGDSADSVARSFGQKLAPLFSLLVTGANAALSAIGNLFKGNKEFASESMSAYENQRKAVTQLQTDISPLLSRYDQLTEKAKKMGGETNLTKKEQGELRNAIDEVAKTIPSAIQAQNEYGRVMSINTGVARDYITEQERVAKVLNADSINKYNESLKLTKQRQQELQKQLVAVQGATPTQAGQPAVSSPTNQGQSTGFRNTKITAEEQRSQIAQIQRDLAAANDEAKNLQATIDYLSGKAEKPKSALPASTVSNTIVGSSGGKKTKTGKDADAKLKEAIDQAKAQTQKAVSGLDAFYASGTTSTADYLNQRLTLLQDGVLKEQELLRKAGKEKSAEYAATEKELNEIASSYLKARSEEEEKAFKAAIDAVSSAIDSDTTALKSKLAIRIADLQVAYNNEEAAIRQQVNKRLISESEGEKRLADLKIKLLRDIADATAANSNQIQQITKTRLDNLETQLRTEGKNEIDIAKALVEEKKKIEKEYNESVKQASDDRVAINAEENAKKKQQDATAADVRKQTEDKIWEAAGTAVNGFFTIATSFREAEQAQLEKQKENELKLSDGSESAKAAIEEKFARKSSELKRKQAIQDKEQAIFNVLLSTSEAVFKTYAQFGFPLGLPLALAIGALGAIEIGVIAATKIPEFRIGTRDAPEGPALVGEAGYELIESKQGGQPTYRLAAEKQITYLHKHDRVYTHAESKRMVAANTELAERVRSAPGGSLYQPVVVNGGTSPAEMEAILLRTLGSQVIHQTTISDAEMKKYIIQKQQKVEWKNEYFSLPKRKR